MSLKHSSENSEIDERLAALSTNVQAIRAVSSAVEGTLGPKGLDTMLVDRFNDVVITNDGVTILDLMEVNHPAARMLINVARSQQEEVGDGTTTTTIIAASLVSEGLQQVLKGVPVAKVIQGIRAGAEQTLFFFESQAINLASLDDPLLLKVALVAGRQHADIANLVVQAARVLGREKLLDPSFKLSQRVVADVGVESRVFNGVIIEKEPVTPQMPKHLSGVKVLVIDDALEPEDIEEEALANEVGFRHYLKVQEEFKVNLARVLDLGIGLVLIDRGIGDLAEEILTDAGVIALQRVAHKQLRLAAELTGARLVKRTVLKKSLSEVEKCLGFVDEVLFDEKLEHVVLEGGKGMPLATILVGAPTSEIVDERERIARDAAAAVQAAVQSGVVAGGGALELAAAINVEGLRQAVHGMVSYGVECVVEALKRPFIHIVTNSGFNALEKLGDVLAAQKEKKSASLALDCDEGQVVDMFALGVVDPIRVKMHGFKAAVEVAEAILRIDTIVRKKESGGSGERNYDQGGGF